MNFPDAPPPASLRLVPEVATAYPRVSRDGTTYTFTLRSGFRFSDGHPSGRARSPTRSSASSRLGSTRTARQYREGHRRRRRVPHGRGANGRRGRRGRESSHRPVHAADSRFPGDDDDAVLLRRPTDTPVRPRGSRHLRRLGPVHRLGVRSRAAASCWNGTGSTGERGHTTWTASSSTSRSSLPRRRSAGSSKARPTGASLRRRPRTSTRRWGWFAKYGVNRSQFFVNPGIASAGIRAQRRAPAVSRQPRLAAGRELRRRPARDRAPGRSREPPRRPADRPVHAAEHAGVPGRAHLPARRA